MLKTDETREEIELKARLDERDEIVQYLRELAVHTRANLKQVPWYARWGVKAGIAALEMAAEYVGKRHLRQYL